MKYETVLPGYRRAGAPHPLRRQIPRKIVAQRHCRDPVHRAHRPKPLNLPSVVWRGICVEYTRKKRIDDTEVWSDARRRRLRRDKAQISALILEACDVSSCHETFGYWQLVPLRDPAVQMRGLRRHRSCCPQTRQRCRPPRLQTCCEAHREDHQLLTCPVPLLGASLRECGREA